MSPIRSSLLALGVFGMAGALATPLASTHARPAYASKATRTVAEWTNPPAIQATQLLDGEFEHARPNVHIRLLYAPTTGGAWGSMQRAQMAAKGIDVTAQFSISGN